MAVKKLQDLTASTSPNDSDIMIIEDTAATKKITFLNLFTKIKTKLGLSNIATSGKLSDATGDVNNRTIKDTERTKWDGYGSTLEELNRNIQDANAKIDNRALTNVDSVNFGYDGKNAFTIDFNLPGGRAAKLVIENTGIRYLYSDGTTWNTIWSK